MSHREKLLFFAKLAEEAERFDEMVDFMKQVVEGGEELNIEERSLLSAAYKNSVGSRRGAWRAFSNVKAKLCGSDDAELEGFLAEYCSRVHTELLAICDSIIQLLDSTLIAEARTSEPRAFYLKMKADYFRYIAEIASDEEKLKAAESANGAYNEAKVLADKELPLTSPIRLGLALNYSVFQYEVLHTPDDACNLARTAFKDAVSDLDNLTEDSFRDAIMIMQVLKDNLLLWTSDGEESLTASDLSVFEGIAAL